MQISNTRKTKKNHIVFALEYCYGVFLFYLVNFIAMEVHNKLPFLTKAVDFQATACQKE